MITKEGFELNLTTTTPALVGALTRDKDWVLARYGREKDGMKGYQKYKDIEKKQLNKSASTNRVTYSFWYKGGA